MKTLRSRDTFVAVQFDPTAGLALPPGVVEVVENGKDVWLYRNKDSYAFEEVKPGDWLLTSRMYGFTIRLSDAEHVAKNYEEVPDAGEGGGAVHPHQVA